MKERPILFNADMVRALLDGRKTQTRRIVNRIASKGLITEFDVSSTDGYAWHFRDRCMRWHDVSQDWVLSRCPFGVAGDQLWVREKWARYNVNQTSFDIAYPATTVPEDWPKDGRWRPSIHMPRWASRITLEITSVRVERLQDISEHDAAAEGVEPNCAMLCHDACTDDDHAGEWIRYPCDKWLDPAYSAKESFESLWQSINGSGSWSANPWVWVVEFKLIKPVPEVSE